MGFGLDHTNTAKKLDFETFCRIKCFFEFYTLSAPELKRIWFKILNPTGGSFVTVTEMWDLFERFARGQSTNEPNIVTRTFADKLINLLKLEDCFTPESHVCMTRLRQAIDNDTFDIELFNQMIKQDNTLEVWSANHCLE